MNASKVVAVFSCVLCACVALAQSPAAGQAAPVAYTSIAELNQLLANLQQASQNAQNDLSRVRIDRWKADSGTKRQTESDTQSILRNLQNALPTMINDLRNSPENLAQTFKVYRNLDALYDVLNSVVESTGAFGSKDDFQSLSKDLGDLEGSRKAFAERLDKLANAKETEIGQLRTELQTARAAATPPKKTVVDDTAPEPKKPVRKKPVPKPKTTTPSATPSPQQPQPQH